MMDKCPSCGSPNLTKPSRDERSAFGSFTMLPLRKCGDCGHVWEPPSPAALWVVSLVLGLVSLPAGLFLLLCFVLSVKDYRPAGGSAGLLGSGIALVFTGVFGLAATLVGAAAVRGSLRRLAGRRRKDG